IAHKVAPVTRHDLFQISQDWRQIVEFGLLRSLRITWYSKKTRCDDQVEEYLRTASDQYRVGEFVEPDDLAPLFRVGRNQRGLGPKRFQILNDRAGVRQRIIAVA